MYKKRLIPAVWTSWNGNREAKYLEILPDLTLKVLPNTYETQGEFLMLNDKHTMVGSLHEFLENPQKFKEVAKLRSVAVISRGTGLYKCEHGIPNHMGCTSCISNAMRPANTP